MHASAGVESDGWLDSPAPSVELDLLAAGGGRRREVPIGRFQPARVRAHRVVDRDKPPGVGSGFEVEP